jgi:hypothetical protein
MKKYLFIGGPANKQYLETPGNVNVMWHSSPICSSDEPGYAYNKRALAIGEAYTYVYVLTMLCNEEAIDLLLHTYAESR